MRKHITLLTRSVSHMINGKDYWCFSVIGKPVTKKRPRIFNNRVFTENSWYEDMIKDSFYRLYPDFKPIGFEYYDVSVRQYKGVDKSYYKLKKGYTELDLPTIRLFIFVYINDGKIGDDDNYVKIVSDALNKTLYMDDRMVKVPTPYIVVDKDEQERVDVLAIKYKQNKDKTFKKLKDFIMSNKLSIDIYDEYEYERLNEYTIDELYTKCCKPLNCYRYDYCNYRRKADIIDCAYRQTIKP